MIRSFTDSWEKCLLIGGYLIINKNLPKNFNLIFFDNKMNQICRAIQNSKSILKEYEQ